MSGVSIVVMTLYKARIRSPLAGTSCGREFYKLPVSIGHSKASPVSSAICWKASGRFKYLLPTLARLLADPVQEQQLVGRM